MKLEENCYYHIYHRGIVKKNVFLGERDYKHFLNRYRYYLLLAVDTYAFCLLKNHIHLLIRVRSTDEQKSIFEKLNIKMASDSLHGLGYKQFKVYSASTQFGHLFNSYTKYFNKREERSGVLFDGRFKRIKVNNEEYLAQLICYIHRNPIHHGFTSNFTTYDYSSYNEILSNQRTLISRNKVLDFLGGRENFIDAHEEFKENLENKYFLEE